MSELGRAQLSRPRYKHPAVVYTLVMIFSAAGLLAQYLFDRWSNQIHFVLLYPTVFMIAWFLGARSGVIATFICFAGADYFFFVPSDSFAIQSGPEAAGLAIFLLAGLAISASVGRTRRSELAAASALADLRNALKELSDFKFALDQASILATTDARGRITYVNDKFCEISKYSREELIGQDHRIINSRYHSKEFFNDLWRTISKGQVWSGEIRNRAKDGSIYWVSTFIIPFLDSRGKPYQYVAIRTDITEKKRAEETQKHFVENLQKAEQHLREAVRSRDEFLSIASHELKTPLTSLRLQLETIKRAEKIKGESDAFSPVRIRKFLSQTERQIDRLTRLVDDMLDISRISVGKLRIETEEVALSETVEELIDRIRPMLDQAGCELLLSIEPEVRGIFDRHRIEQVFINLLTNAVRYGEGKPVEVTLRSGREYVEFIVRDHGRGVAKEDQERIFQRFERAVSANEISGLGLGLFISRQITEMHGGSISIRSEVGSGSEFTVRLPLRQLTRYSA